MQMFQRSKYVFATIISSLRAILSNYRVACLLLPYWMSPIIILNWKPHLRLLADYRITASVKNSRLRFPLNKHQIMSASTPTYFTRSRLALQQNLSMFYLLLCIVKCGCLNYQNRIVINTSRISTLSPFLPVTLNIDSRLELRLLESP